MSRRRVDGPQPSFLSDDDDDDYAEDFDNEAVMSKSRTFYQTDEHENLERSKRQGRSSQRMPFYTSSPMDHHGSFHISAHDHYYDGMLLRSGSHVQGVNGMQESSESSDETYNSRNSALVPTYRSDLEGNESRRSRRNVTTTMTTSTTTHRSFNKDEEDANSTIVGQDQTFERERSRRMKESAVMKQNMEVMEDEEMKLKLDESETEKLKKRGHYRLQHLDGLDSEDEISDVEVADAKYLSGRTELASDRYNHQRSAISRLSTFFIMIITTITTTVAESTQQYMSPVATMLLKPVTVPSQWFWRALISTCRWFMWNSSSVLMLDIETKQRRRRGCCFCLLPLLLLLPLALLAGHYSGPVKDQVGGFLSSSESAISSYWVTLWVKSGPVVIHTPPPEIVTSHQLDMTEINQYIQQTVLQVWNEEHKEVPKSLSSIQVEAIVRAMLAKEIDSTKEMINGEVNSLAGLHMQDVSSLKQKLKNLEELMIQSTKDTHIVAGELHAAKDSFHSMNEKQRTEWLAVAEAQETKCLDMRNEVNGLANQNAALAALLRSCCQNNSMLADNVRAQLMTLLSQMTFEDGDSGFGNLMAFIGEHYVHRNELDKKLSAVAKEVAEKMRIALARQAEENQAKNGVLIQNSMPLHSRGLDELTVKAIVEESLTQFSADRVGIPDFALESAGGSVLNIRCSETYYRKTALVSVFGIPLWYMSNSPRTVIQPSVHPGECWAFKGSSGFLVVQLSQPVQPTGFTLEHIPRALAPMGNIDSAPQAFAVFGLTAEDDNKGITLGNYTYQDSGKPIQHFPIQNRHPGVFQFVELRILTNHGNPEYTCVYRFRVHGLP